ncbi:uncharacterized protein [Solanum lycopersicum]|uniref:DUF7086 domain-containing protein n=1 Tax=Solanum lycopersicum TaxID=4081 RepID=A0A3Q7HWE7_SOLLC|nr:uncharacterized protein LOC101258478 [Solanum lycopersicum]
MATNSNEIDHSLLTLSLSFSPSPVVAPPPPPPPPPPPSRRPRKRKRTLKSETIPAPYPWATNHRAKIHSLNVLRLNQISTITGEVQCRRCERKYEIGFDLCDKFAQVGSFISANKESMHQRAPDIWMSPMYLNCNFCEQENSVKPIISSKKKSINWVFLLLGQFIGFCTLDQLKYFCKHNEIHRTGAKDRVLYQTYLCLCRQLDNTGPFDY